ncbi:hypothetical protein D3C81_1733790 [compost metagenome]
MCSDTLVVLSENRQPLNALFMHAQNSFCRALYPRTRSTLVRATSSENSEALTLTDGNLDKSVPGPMRVVEGT